MKISNMTDKQIENHISDGLPLFVASIKNKVEEVDVMGFHFMWKTDTQMMMGDGDMGLYVNSRITFTTKEEAERELEGKED